VRLTRRLLGAAVAVAACGGMALAGSASTSPTIDAGPKVASVTFTATVLDGGNTYAINSTKCMITYTTSGEPIKCSLTGAGTLSEGDIQTAQIAIVSKRGVISLSLGSITTCGTGSGEDVPNTGNPKAVVAITQSPWGSGSTVMGTIQIYETGTRVITCMPPGTGLS